MPSFLDEIDKNRELFLQFNETKRERFQQLIVHPMVRKVVNTIPILLSTNTKRLPGYVDGEVPCGIANFKPDTESEKFLQSRFNVRNIPLVQHGYFVEMFAVMGSVGTIAYTKESDFDYWVCIDRRSVTPEKLRLFIQKVEAIEKWAVDEMEIDMHIFINDIADIKNNIFAESSEEAFGSIIGAVLKDEFFRSSVIIAGKVPFWWVIPRFVRDVEYEKWYGLVPPEMKERLFIDLGNLFEISKQDFVGAALFLIIKSLGNPFKSLIKLGLLERYLFAPDNSPLLSQKVKSAMLRGSRENRILDSYILMFEEVYDYYETQLNDAALLNNIRQNLYLKIDPQLSKYLGIKDNRNLPYKVLVMFRYVKEWGWTARDIQDLDNFAGWDYKRTMVFWNMVRRFMLLSYQKIVSQIPSMNLENRISDSDFKLLSRKIKSHFSSEKNKIDHYISFKETPYESILIIEPAAGSGINDNEWSLIKRAQVADDKFTSTVVRTEKGLVRLLAWTAINQIFHSKFSRVKFQSGYGRINQNTVIDLLGSIADLFAGTRARIKNDFYLRPHFNMVNMIILNFGIENCEEIQTIHHLYQTSWGESYIDEYASPGDLVPILGKILHEATHSKNEFQDYCIIKSPEPFKKHYKEIEQIFQESYKFIVRSYRSQSLRFITSLAGRYVMITREGEVVTLANDADFAKTLARISLNPKKDTAFSVYGADQNLQVLDAINKLKKNNAITVVFEERSNLLVIYVVNERGNLFTFTKPKELKEEAVIYLFDFCQNVIKKINQDESVTRINPVLQFYQLAVDRFGKCIFENRSRWAEELYLVKFRSRKPLAVIVSKYKSIETLYSITASGDSNSIYVPLKRVSEFAENIRKSDRAVVRLVGDVRFIDLKDEDLGRGTTPYFHEKFRVEFVMEKIGS